MAPADPRLSGVVPILSMPFTDADAVDHEGLRRQVDWLKDGGITGMGLGFGSELPRLTDAELVEAGRTVADRAGAGCAVLFPVHGGSIAALRQRALAALDTGATHLMVTPPASAHVTPDALAACCADIGQRTGLPIVLQDAPTMTGVALPPQALADLTERTPAIVALKIEPLQPAQKIGAVRDLVGGGVTILGGAGGLEFTSELRRGSDGTVPFAALATMFAEVHRLFLAGHHAESRTLFNVHLPLLSLAMRSLDVALYVHKELLRRYGVIDSAALRPPAEPIDPHLLDDLDIVLDDIRRADVAARVTPSSAIRGSDRC